MGFLEKLKNTFFEEEYVEVEEKPVIKKEVKKQVVEHEEAAKPEVIRSERKEVVKEVREEKIEVPKATKVVKEEVIVPKEEVPVKQEGTRREKFNYFDDEDFLDMNDEYYRNQEARRPEVRKQEVVKQPVQQPKLYDNPSYASKKPSSMSGTSPYPKEAKEGFRPTPIISPIYGILDKNYTKEEVKIERQEPSSYVSRKNVDLDSVREKAYGSITSDFDLVGNVKDERVRIDSFDDEDDNADLDIDDNLLYDMTDINKTPTVDKVTLQDAEEYFQDLGLEYNVDYKDARHEKVTGRRVSKTPKLEKIEVDLEEERIIDSNEEDEIIFTKTEDKKSENREDISLEDNLFDLIDSMYEEKE